MPAAPLFVGALFGVIVYLGLIFLSFVGVCYGPFRIYDAFRAYDERTVVRDTPLSSPSSLAFGPAAVRGRVEVEDEPLRAPLGGADCVAYDLEVRQTSGDSMRTLADDQQGVSFFLATEDGRVRVDPRGARLDVTGEGRLEREVDSHESRPPALLAFDRANGFEDRPAGADRTYEQSTIRPGDELYVHGRAERDDRADRETAKPAVLVAGEGPFLLADRGPEELVAERRWSLLKAVGLGVPVSAVSLAALLWLTGIAQVFLGASPL
jgi:hypothetical protein